MKVAVISDIHANRHAFEATLEAVAASDAAELWCLGDLVGYGAEPDACVELAREHAAVCLAGNHDMAVTGEIPLDEFSRGASLAAQWTREVIAPENLKFLKGLVPQGQEESVGLYHASPRDPVWEYVLSALLAELCMDAQTQRICLIGHSHVALSFARHDGELATGEPRRDGRRAWTWARANGCSTPAASGSRATATRGPRGCCSTSTAWPRRSTAPTTTSPARLPPSAPRACPTRWPSAWSTVNEPRCAAARHPTRARDRRPRRAGGSTAGVRVRLQRQADPGGRTPARCRTTSNRWSRRRKAADGDCSTTEAALLKTEQDFNGLPATVDSGLHARLQEGIAKLREDALARCAKPLTTSGTTSTSKAPTKSTPTKTQTTSTSTETQSTNTQTTTTSSTPTSTSPGGGTQAPEEGAAGSGQPGAGEQSPGTQSPQGQGAGGQGGGTGVGEPEGNGAGTPGAGEGVK